MKQDIAPGLLSDPITFELLKNSVFSLADEMALTIVRTAYSGVLKDIMDFSTAVCDAKGQLVAQGLTQAPHLGSIPDAISSVLRKFGSAMRPGDVYCLNDPFSGGMHLPDIFVFKPVFYEGECIAIATTVCHHTDVGGRVAGSNASDSTETYAEGLRIPPLKMYDAGVPNETLFALIETNVRLPEHVRGDLRAQLAACHIAEEGLHRLADDYGVEAVKAHFNELLDYAERLTRTAIRELPDGEFSFEDWIDDDGIDVGRPIPIRVCVRKKGDGVVVDWTGTSPQVSGAINATYSFTKSNSYTGIRSILPAGIPNNEGFFRAIEVIAPPGTVAHVVLPGASAARGLTGFRMVDCLFGALAMMVPDKVYAASEGGNTGITIGGYYADRRPFIYVDFLCSAWGGRPWADGLSGNANMSANMALQSAEICELEQPLEVLACEFIQDVMGAGKYRGGASVRRDYRFLESEAILQVRSDRRTFRPFGLYGGSAGKPSQNIMNPDTVPRLEPSKITMMIHRGDVYRHEMPGPGGWGDPLEREPGAVLRDVRNEFVSLGAAREEYGVVVDTGNWTIDRDATVAQRESLRRARQWTSTPAVVRE